MSEGLTPGDSGNIEPALGKKAESMDVQHGNSDLKSTLGTQWGNYLFFSEYVTERHSSQRKLSQNKGTDWHHFPFPFLSRSTCSHVGTGTVPTLAA